MAKRFEGSRIKCKDSDCVGYATEVSGYCHMHHAEHMAREEKRRGKGIGKDKYGRKIYRAKHEALTLTKRQAKRIAQGVVESRPSDYSAASLAPEDVRRRDARHRLEDLAIIKDLSID